VCAKCGKEAPKAYENDLYEYERTNDSPSGEWLLAYCSRECLEGTRKPGLAKEQPKQTIKCEHCGKSKGVSFSFDNTLSGKIFCSESCCEAAGHKIKYDEVCCHTCSGVFELRSLSKEESDNG